MAVSDILKRETSEQSVRGGTEAAAVLEGTVTVVQSIHRDGF